MKRLRRYGMNEALIAVFAFGVRLLPAYAYAEAGWQKSWDETVAAAKKEGSVVVTASPSPRTRKELEPAFKKAFGFGLEYMALGGSQATARVEREAAAGVATIDVLLSGNTELFNLLPAGRLQPIADKLLLPEVADPAQWRQNKLKFNDPERRYMLQTMEYILPDVFINTSIIKKGAITSWEDLLKPEYAGKIASFDPRRGGQGQAIAAYLLDQYQADFIKRLYVGQKVVYTGNRRQLGEWLARGTYPIAIAVATREVENHRKLGVPIDRIFSRDTGGVTGGSSVIKMIKNAPHPNAAVVFLNWFLTREPQQIYQRTNEMVSRRKDAGVEGVPDYVIPMEGRNYLDTYSLEYMKFYPKARKMLQGLLGGR